MEYCYKNIAFSNANIMITRQAIMWLKWESAKINAKYKCTKLDRVNSVHSVITTLLCNRSGKRIGIFTYWCIVLDVIKVHSAIKTFSGNKNGKMEKNTYFIHLFFNNSFWLIVGLLLPRDWNIDANSTLLSIYI